MARLSAALAAFACGFIPVLGVATLQSSTSSCSRPNVQARMDEISVPNVAPLVREAFLGVYPWDGTTNVRVSLDKSGALYGARIASSSGNPWLDRAALDAARHARYAAAIVDCAPVGGDYLIVVQFRDGS
jgi:TonB family protein